MLNKLQVRAGAKAAKSLTTITTTNKDIMTVTYMLIETRLLDTGTTGLATRTINTSLKWSTIMLILLKNIIVVTRSIFLSSRLLDQSLTID